MKHVSLIDKATMYNIKLNVPNRPKMIPTRADASPRTLMLVLREKFWNLVRIPSQLPFLTAS